VSTRTDNSSFTGREEAQPDAALMSARVRQVVFDYLDRRAAGEPVTHQSVLADHPELLPDLALALKHMGIVGAACEEVAASGASSFAVRCPNCHAATKVTSDSSLVSVICSACGSTFSLIDDSADELPRSGAIGPFELTRWLGSGAFGEVYHARDTRLDRVVALKVPRRGRLGREDSERFFREARAAAQLQHPNIVSLYEVGRADDTVYIVSAFIDGTSLADWPLRQQRVSAREAAALCQKLAGALEHAHAAGVVHRDLKPANVLVDSAGEPHISDFGLARRDSGEVTMTTDGVLVGTPAYMSPEQARGDSHSADARSDIYSLGVILFELLTGELPFRGNVRRVTEQIVSEEPPSPRKLNTTVPRDLETITLKCLEKDPARRYRAAKDLADDLDRWRKGEPIHARPTSSAEKLWRWCRRKPALAASLLSISILFLVVSIGSPIAVFRINRARQTAVMASNNETRLRRLADRRVYAADMKLAQRALEVNNLGGALRLLNRHRPTDKSQPDLRGWEWRYLWGQCQSDADDVFCKTSSIMSLAVSADGAWLATGLDSTGVSIWDRSTRREIERLPARGFFVHVAFSPTQPLLAYSDQPGFGSADRNYYIHLWDGATRQRVATLPINNHCYGLAFSEDGQTLVTSTQNMGNHPAFPGAITLWRVADRSMVASYPIRQYATGEGTPFALARDGSFAAHLSGNDKVRVMDLATGQERWERKATDDYILALALSPDGKTLASGEGYSASVIRLWDVTSGRELGRLEGHRAGIHQLIFWPDGKTLASASLDQTIRLWDVSDPANGREINTLSGHTSKVRTLALLPDQRTLASGSADGTVYLWNTARKPKERKYLTIPMANTWGWRFTADSQFLVTIYEGDDRTMSRVARWSRDSDFQEMELLLELGADIIDEAWISQDCRWLATSYDGGEVRIWDLQARRQTGKFNTGLKRAIPREFIAEGKKLLIVDDSDNSLHEWDLTPGREKESRTWPSAPGRYTGALSADGKWRLTSILNPDTKRVTALTDLSTGRETDLNLPWYVAASFSPDGRFFALGSWQSDARLFETAGAREVARLRDVFGQVQGVGFSPDSRRLLTGHGSGSDENVAVWDMESYEKLLELESVGSLFDTVAFSPDGNVLAASNWRWMVHLWPAPSWEEIREAEQPFPGDEGRIKRWLVLAPIPLASGKRGADALRVEQIPGEASLRPTEGEAVTVANRELRWREATIDQGYTIDINEIVGQETNHSVAYAVCYIRSEALQRGLQLLMGSDDQAKVYLNGRDIHKHTFSRPFAADQDVVPDITLQRGLNVLVFKVVNELYAWQGSIRFTDAQGNPVQGIHVTLTP
jgi:serine/threonine protein kinase/WD40 repeat protein